MMPGQARASSSDLPTVRPSAAASTASTAAARCPTASGAPSRSSVPRSGSSSKGPKAMRVVVMVGSLAGLSPANLVERFFDRITQFRGLAARPDRNAENFLAAPQLAAIRIWLAAI